MVANEPPTAIKLARYVGWHFTKGWTSALNSKESNCLPERRGKPSRVASVMSRSSCSKFNLARSQIHARHDICSETLSEAFRLRRRGVNRCKRAKNVHRTPSLSPNADI